MIRATSLAILSALLCTSVASAAHLTFSIGVRETGSGVPIGDDGGSTGDIEWIDQDLHSVELDGTWQEVTIDLGSPNSVTGFAGATADGVLDGADGTLEHLRILNDDGITDPIELFFDDLIYRDVVGSPTTIGWEGLTVGDEAIFQEPSFSGSTAGNLSDSGLSTVTDAEALTGTQSYSTSFQFSDASPTGWLRLTTFDAANIPNPAIGFDGTLSFSVMGIAIPEPSSAMIALASLLGLVVARRRS